MELLFFHIFCSLQVKHEEEIPIIFDQKERVSETKTVQTIIIKSTGTTAQDNNNFNFQKNKTHLHNDSCKIT